MPGNHPNDGRIGKEIDWSLVIPSITRPTGEPPALEVLDRFEPVNDGQDGILHFNDDRWKAMVPNIEVRLQMADLMSEWAPSKVYYDWVKKTLEAAKTVRNQDKIAFYEGLKEALKVEMKDLMMREWIPLCNEHELWTPLLRSMHSSDSDTDENNHSEVDTPDLQPQSASPPETDSRSDHNNTIDNDEASDHEISKAINVDALPIADPAPPNTARTERPTRGIFAAMARNLCCYAPSPDEE